MPVDERPKRNGWRPKPGDWVARRPRQAEIRPAVVRMPVARLSTRNLASASTVLYGFALLIGIGTVLLALPFSSADGSFTDIVDALFTATSAVTVTGLIVTDTPVYWSGTGHAIILALILIGGTGWLALAGFMLILLGQRLTLQQRLALRNSLGAPHLGGVVRLLRGIMLTFLGLQVLGGIVLSLRFRSAFDWEWSQALWQGFFHAVSGFNNAGFTIMEGSRSLSYFASDVIVVGVMGLLIVLGGLSFPVMAEVVRIRRFARLALDAKLVVTLSLLLWVLGAVVIFAMEYDDPGTLGPLSVGDKMLNAVFQSITARAAGFSSVDIGLLAPSTAFFIIGLMFIGTASASVGGGIRLNTLGVLLAAVWSAFHGREQVTCFGRELSAEQIHRAIAITAFAFFFVFIVAFILIFTEDSRGQFIDFLFEVVSAIGTVGLSRGVTPMLSIPGELLIILSMLIGRLGPLLLALMVSQRELHPPLYRYARERVTIG